METKYIVLIVILIIGALALIAAWYKGWFSSKKDDAKPVGAGRPLQRKRSYFNN